MKNIKESPDTESTVVEMHRGGPRAFHSRAGSLLAAARFRCQQDLGLCRGNLHQTALAGAGDASGSVSADSVQTHSLRDHRASK